MLTERTIRNQKPGPKNADSLGRKAEGIGMPHHPHAGSQAFVLRYTDAKGRQRLATLARVSEVSLKHARELAARELVKIRMGEDDLLTRRKERRDSHSVAQGSRLFLRGVLPQARGDQANDPRDRTGIPQAGGTLPDSSELGNLDVDEVKRRHVERMVDPLAPGSAQSGACSHQQNLQVLRRPGPAATIRQPLSRY